VDGFWLAHLEQKELTLEWVGRPPIVGCAVDSVI